MKSEFIIILLEMCFCTVFGSCVSEREAAVCVAGNRGLHSLICSFSFSRCSFAFSHNKTHSSEYKA